MSDDLTIHRGAELSLDASRVITRLFLPGEERAHSRAAEIIDRVLAIPEHEVTALVSTLLADFAHRHDDYATMLEQHALVAASHIGSAPLPSSERSLLLGASFTAEYAVEGAALCNPSTMPHPDQTALPPGTMRVAVSLRAIGEGHVSSIGFCSAVIGPGEQWQFESRQVPTATGVTSPGHWQRTQLEAVLADQGHIDEVGAGVLHALPPRFTGADLEQALTGLLPALIARFDSGETIDLLRRLVSSTYAVEFAATTNLSQRVLFPSAVEESHGMEDARFTHFVDDDGRADYRATYTAYDGQRLAPRMLISSDLRSFQAHRLAGPAARNKGMAFFPRKIGGRHWALCRADGENTSVSMSEDGFVWGPPHEVHHPVAAWEIIQVGNCGPPIETPQGWLVLTHGVGPMRSYAIGAVLLDLDDPTRMIARLERPLIEPAELGRDGYVPNVVYSCGAILHDGLLWLPFGVNDNRIAVASIRCADLLADMGPVT